jgi:hypothetical protein
MKDTSHTNSLIRDVLIPEEIAVLKGTITRLVDRANRLQGQLRGAICLLDHVDATTVDLHWGTRSAFMEDRRNLHHEFEQITKLPVEALGCPVEWPIVVD